MLNLPRDVFDAIARNLGTKEKVLCWHASKGLRSAVQRSVLSDPLAYKWAIKWGSKSLLRVLISESPHDGNGYFVIPNTPEVFDRMFSATGCRTLMGTALHFAVGLGNVESVAMLLRGRRIRVNKETRGVDPHSEISITPLHMATELGMPQIVRLLLKHGAAKTHTSSYGETPLACAAGSLCLDSVKELLTCYTDKDDYYTCDNLEEALLAAEAADVEDGDSRAAEKRQQIVDMLNESLQSMESELDDSDSD